MPARSLVLPKRTAHLSRTAASVGTAQHQRRWVPFLVVVAGGVLAILPAVLQGIPNNYDLQHHYHFAVPFYEALRVGNIFPGWLAESNNGFGDPVFRFYPPAFYYLIAAARAVAGSWYVASLLALTIVSVLGACGAYFAARSYVGAREAAVAGLFYAFMPYHVSEVYQAALLAEFAGGAALLFAFAFVKRICDGGNRRDVVGLSIAYGLLLLTHLPLAVLGSMALVVYAASSIEIQNLRSTVVRLTVSVIMSVGLTAFYWSRMVFELGWIRSDGTHPNPLLDYRLNFLLSSFSPDQNLTLWWMNVLLAATIVMLLPALILFRRQALSQKTIGLFIVLLFSIFMATPLSRPLWTLITPLQRAQHPFRWLAITSTVVPILLAMATPFWVQLAKTKKRPFALLAVGALAIPLAFTAGQTIRDANYLSRRDFEAMIQSVISGPSINAWLPKWAETASMGGAADDKCVPPKTPRELVEAESRAVNIEFWNSQNRRFSVGPGNETFARVRTFYYPHWHAMSNNQELGTTADENGRLMIALPPEAVSVDLAFVEPFRVKAAAGLSAASWLGCFVLLIPFRRRSQMRTESIGMSAIVNEPLRRTSELQQEQHYDEIAFDYEAHYSDESSRAYRWQFIYGPMFDGIDLAGQTVLDAMCGSGQTTEYLLSKGASVTGLDISSEIVNAFRARCPDTTILQRSLLHSALPAASFDCISIVGGLHHIHPYVHEAVTEIHRLLKPGGYFCFMEPHSRSFPDLIRRFWYKHDRFFSDNEAAMDVKRMENDFATQFSVRRKRYLGNVAFLFVLNSLIFRIPVRLKRYYSPLLLPLESVLMKFQTKATSCFVVAQWQKR